MYDAATHTMVYEPLAMRDGEYVHTHFGAEGLCRTSNVGFNMQVSVCLRVYSESGRQEDFACVLLNEWGREPCVLGT